MKGLKYMVSGVLVSFSHLAGYATNELNRVDPEIWKHQMRTAMKNELIQLQHSPEVGRCIAERWEDEQAHK